MLTQNAVKVLEKRYLIKDKNGKPTETPKDLFRRVAATVAKAFPNDQDYTEKFYGMMMNMEFLPNTPTLMNAGRPLGQLSGCFVLPIEDSMDSIFGTLKNTSLVHKSGGGTGFSFGRLRSRNSTVNSTMGVSSGPVSFMKVYNAATEAIKQGGTRRGANMGILPVNHPDIMEFITCKEDDKEITNFNISVAITDEFMKAVEADGEYELVHPKNSEPIKMKARDVFNKIVEQAWKNGEPGVIFIDKINAGNPTPKIGMIESTNPCGEQPLLPYESCNLGSINLAKMTKVDSDGKTILDTDKLIDTVKHAIIFMDNVVQINNYPIPEIKAMTEANRKLGLGVMGLADLFIQLGIKYDSEEGITMAKGVMGIINVAARHMSNILGTERGSFPNYEHSIFSGTTPRRNATLTTIAPTGTISMIAGASGGIEPLFALVYTRKNILGGEELAEIYPPFEKLANDLNLNEAQLKQIQKEGSLQRIEGIPQEVKNVFRTAFDISPEWHLKMQAVVQDNVDNAVSKTINLPETATKEDVHNIYMMAYKLNCKGVTIYRNKSRSTQVLNLDDGIVNKKFQHRKPRPRPAVTKGGTFKINTGCGNMYVTINEDEHGLYEVFQSVGKVGPCATALLETLSRMISLCFKTGVDPHEVVGQLKGIRCASTAFGEGGVVFSCVDGVSKILEEYLIENGGCDVENCMSSSCVDCPECGAKLAFSEGCAKCPGCGYSKCG